MHVGYPNKQRSRKCVLLCQLFNNLPCLKWRTVIHSRKLLAAVHCCSSFFLMCALCFSVSSQENYGYRVVILAILSMVCVTLLLSVCNHLVWYPSSAKPWMQRYCTPHSGPLVWGAMANLLPIAEERSQFI